MHLGKFIDDYEYVKRSCESLDFKLEVNCFSSSDDKCFTIISSKGGDGSLYGIFDVTLDYAKIFIMGFEAKTIRDRENTPS